MKIMPFSSFLATLFLGACVTVPGTNSSQLNFFSPQQESKMGAEAYNEMLKKEKEAKNPRIKAMLLRVGSRISQVAEARHRAGFQWEFKLIESKEANAFCLPGGKVAFYTGILAPLENEAAMAMVMGHEVAHATLRHGGQRMSQAYFAQGLVIGSSLLGTAFIKDPKYRNLSMAALGLGVSVGVILPFSRSNEAEADAYGLEYAAAAGYEPSEAAAFWSRFSKKNAGKEPPAFLSTHPSNQSRINNLSTLKEKVEPIYLRSPQYGLGEQI
ncbi:MAG: M48 family metallopeptidase [Bdellovibrionota bacterium]